MSDQPKQTPILELARGVPKDLRAQWESQWREDGTPTGHTMAPVGRYVHELVDMIEELQAEVDRLVDALNKACEPIANGPRVGCSIDYASGFRTGAQCQRLTAIVAREAALEVPGE